MGLCVPGTGLPHPASVCAPHPAPFVCGIMGAQWEHRARVGGAVQSDPLCSCGDISSMYSSEHTGRRVA